MRCRACDKPLTRDELMRSDEDYPEWCYHCTSAALTQYNILTDKNYQMEWTELPVDIER